jgi:DNA-binding NarL/FixJ family response regulator
MILYLTKDLLFQSRVVGAAQRAGQTIVCGPNLAALTARLGESEGVPTLLIDLTLNGMEIEDCIQQFREACGEGRIIAYGPHVQAEALQAAARAGCEVYTRGQFDHKMEQILA